MICWKCKESVQSMICVGCSTIQPPPPNPDFFEVLSLRKSYFVTPEDINAAHRVKIRLVHPDRFVKKSAVERRMSLQWTAFLNEAKRVLSNSNIRARYIATGEVKPKEVGGPRLSGEFLEYILKEIQLCDNKLYQDFDLNDHNVVYFVIIFERVRKLFRI